MTTVAEAFVSLRPKTDGFEAEAESGIGAPMKRVAAGIAAAFVATKVKDFLSDSIAAAAEANRISAQTEAVIASTGGAAGVTQGHIEDFAHQLQGLSGVQDETIQTGQNMLLTFTNIRNGIGEGNDIFDQATQAMLDMSVATGTDAQGAAVQLGKALNDPIAGISALSRVGVSFTDQQKDQIKMMMAAGDTAGAQKVILAELNKEFGGSAKAAGNAMTPMQRLGLAFGDLQETVGKKLLPVIEKVVGFFAEHTELIVPLAAVIGGVLVAAFAAWAISAATAAAATLAAAAPVIAIGVAIAALVAGIWWLVANWDEVWAKVKEIAVVVIDAVVDFIQKLPGRALEVLQAAWHLLSDYWQAVFDAVKSYVSDRVSDVVGFVSGLPQRAKDALSAAWSTFASFWASVFDAVKSYVSDRVSDVVGFVSGLPQRAVDVLKAAWHLYWDYYIGAWLAVASFVGDRIGDVIGFVTGLPGRAKDALVGAWHLFWDHWTMIVGAIKTFVSDTFTDIVGAVTEMPGKIASAATGMWDGIKDAFKSALNTIIGWWNDLEFEVPKVHVPGTNVDVGGFTLGTPYIKPLAVGGPALADRPYLVGERGPELFVPGTSGTVVPNHALGDGELLDALERLIAEVRRQTDKQLLIARTG